MHMQNETKMIKCLAKLVLLLLFISSNCVSAQFEESIFEDEDIYAQALPEDTTGAGLTVPGTKCCGPGNTAANYNDLGSQRDTDSCCRQHDYCEDILEASSTKHGLSNTDWFPIMACTCEQKFINCLQKTNTLVSNTLGRVYFGSRSKCFAKGYPIIDCKQYQEGTIRKRCIRYNVNKHKTKEWQLYDIPFYSITSQNVDTKSIFRH